MQEFRDRWEALEKENLAADVNFKLNRSEYSNQYKEMYENMDNLEMEKIVDDAIQSAIPEEGQESLTEEEKVMVAIKAKF